MFKLWRQGQKVVDLAQIMRMSVPMVYRDPDCLDRALVAYEDGTAELLAAFLAIPPRRWREGRTG